jgi:hypothetical protein
VEGIECGVVFEVFCGLPGWLIVACPLDQVLEVASAYAAIQYFVDVVFLFVINYDRGRWRLNLSRYGILSGRI